MNALAEPGNVAFDPMELAFPVPNGHGASQAAGRTVRRWVVYVYSLAAAQATCRFFAPSEGPGA